MKRGLIIKKRGAARIKAYDVGVLASYYIE
jgi:hypothetical protein